MDKLKVGITGVDGFIGSHLRDRLTREEEISLVPFEDSFFEEPDRIKAFLSNANVVVHLAAINRGEPDELYNTNVALVTKLVSHMEELKVKPHVIFSSSIQNVLDNPYGLSKKEGERILENWSKRNNAPVTILVIPNVYGDRCRPHYNSVVATFCYELTHGGKPEIHIDKEFPKSKTEGRVHKNLKHLFGMIHSGDIRKENPKISFHTKKNSEYVRDADKKSKRARKGKMKINEKKTSVDWLMRLLE